MEPKLPAPNLGLEHMPVGYSQNVEHIPRQSTPERAVERHAEQFERSVESNNAATLNDAAMPILPPVVGSPSSVPIDDTVSLVTDAPLVANDDDLIEKEWVDKAKKIIAQTKDDPYRREHEVGKLQADYLRKRYGKELGAPQ
jgi:hypothetical protein